MWIYKEIRSLECFMLFLTTLLLQSLNMRYFCNEDWRARQGGPGIAYHGPDHIAEMPQIAEQTPRRNNTKTFHREEKKKLSENTSIEIYRSRPQVEVYGCMEIIIYKAHIVISGLMPCHTPLQL